MINQGKNITIGLFVLAALSILVFILLYLHPSAGDNAQIIHVRFNNIDKVSVGTRVTLGGKPVGEVTEIEEVPQAREEQQVLHSGPIFIYKLTLALDSHVKVYKSDTFSVRTSGLLGERSIEITPGAPLDEKPLELINSNDLIFSEAAGSIEETMKELGVLSKKVEITIDYVNDQLLEIKQRKLWENISKTAKNLQEITAALDEPELLKESIKNFHTVSANAIEVSKNAITVFNNAATVSTDVLAITDKIKKGEGTIGRLLGRDDLYLMVTSVLSKANTLMDDINHYGLLFNNDKKWQRVRARRINLLNTLSTPQEFRNFFEDEVNQITTSLSRVSMVLNETTLQCGPQQVFTDREFEQVFSELLHRVKSLEENLNLYDQQVVEMREKGLFKNHEELLFQNETPCKKLQG